MKKIVVWGATGQLIVLEEFLSALGYEIVALFDNNKNLTSPLKNVPLYYGEKQFVEWWKKNNIQPCYFTIAIGGWKGKDRLIIHEILKSHGLIPASVIHPASFVASNAKIGQGCQILARACIGAKTFLHNQVIINTAASVDHECNIADGVHIAPGVVMAGCVSVGKNSFIGTGAVVLPRINIGQNVIIGAGSVVTKDVPEGIVAYGNPARIIRKTYK